MNLPVADFCALREKIRGRAATSTMDETTLVAGGDGPVPARLPDPANDCGRFVYLQDA